MWRTTARSVMQARTRTRSPQGWQRKMSMRKTRRNISDHGNRSAPARANAGALGGGSEAGAPGGAADGMTRGIRPGTAARVLPSRRSGQVEEAA